MPKKRADVSSVERYTFQRLLNDLLSYEALKKQADNWAAKVAGVSLQGSPSAAYCILAAKQNAEAHDVWKSFIERPGVGDIKALCVKLKRRFDSKTLKQVRDQLCLKLNCSSNDIDAKTVEQIGKLADAIADSSHTKTTEADKKGGKAVVNSRRKSVSRRRSNIDRRRRSSEECEELFKAALVYHHGYENDGSVSNYDPISTREVERQSGISHMTAQRLFEKHFGSVKKYQTACLSGAINQKLATLLGDARHDFSTLDSMEIDSIGSVDADG
jgi:hypothetical protein